MNMGQVWTKTLPELKAPMINNQRAMNFDVHLDTVRLLTSYRPPVTTDFLLSVSRWIRSFLLRSHVNFLPVFINTFDIFFNVLVKLTRC